MSGCEVATEKKWGATYENALLERIGGERVRVDRMQSRNSHDRRERPAQKDAHQRELLLLGPVDLEQGRYGQGDDEDVGDDVHAGGEVEEGRGIDAVAVDAVGRDGPELVDGPALAGGRDEADDEEGDMEDDGSLADNACHVASHWECVSRASAERRGRRTYGNGGTWTGSRL